MRRAPCYPKRHLSRARVGRVTGTNGSRRRRVLVAAAVYAMLEDRRRLEHHHPAWRNGYFLAGLGIAAYPLALFAHHERAERRQLHSLAPFEAIRDFFQHQFNKRGRFGARKTYLLVDRFTQIG